MKLQHHRLERQFKTLKAIREFFLQQGFTDVMTPPAVENPGMEPHIHPFQLMRAQSQEKYPYYLHTSPEFYMKELLSLGFEKIFTITHAFRDERKSSTHRFQFLMLEWYRANERYEQIMLDTIELIKQVASALQTPNPKIIRKTVQEIFFEFTNIDILNYLEITPIQNLIKERFPHLIPGSFEDWKNLGWEDYFFLIFLNEIEPHFKKYEGLLLYEFPAPLAALSTLKKDDHRLSERFEIYLNGVEICNAYNELTDAKEQSKRFRAAVLQKQDLYNYTLPKPERFLKALETGIPPSAGIALGIERLIMSLTKDENVFWD